MRICRFDDDQLGDNRLGLVDGDTIRDVTIALDSLPPLRWPLPLGDQMIAQLDRLRPAILAAAANAPTRKVNTVRLLSPVANPAHIIAAPLNYRLHVQESADPAINHGVHMPGHEGFATPIDKYGLFLKSQTGLIGPSQTVLLHFPGRRNDHEVELAVIIGKQGKNISRADAMQHVAGYAIGLDMTVRGPEDRSFRKSADTYSVLGPWLVTADEIAEPGALGLRISVDGAPRQNANTRDLIVDIPDLILRASAVYALHPGDIIMTGTPEGVGEVAAGCLMHAEIDQIGAMDVRVAA